MTISILLPDLRGGGAERVNLDLAHEFARQGYRVVFVLMRAEGEFLPEARAAFDVVDLKAPRARNVPTALARYLRTDRPDALIASLWPLTFAAVVAQKLARSGTKVMVVEHSTLSAQYRGQGHLHHAGLRLSLALETRLADVAAAVSSGAAADVAHLAFRRADRVRVLNNPIPLRAAPSLAAQSAANAFWSAADSARILSVGSFKEVKNNPLMLRAYARVRRERPAQLMMLGQGDGEAALRALARDLGIADDVIFAGFHPDPTPFYQSADVFVLSSDYEGFGNVIVEALANGLPVVSTECPSGPAEILKDGEFGTLVPVRDEVALAHAIGHSLDTPSDPEKLCRRAAEFAPEIAARRYLDLLFP